MGVISKWMDQTKGSGTTTLGRDVENTGHWAAQYRYYTTLATMSLARKRRNDRAESPSLPHPHSAHIDSDEKVRETSQSAPFTPHSSSYHSAGSPSLESENQHSTMKDLHHGPPHSP